MKQQNLSDVFKAALAFSTLIQQLNHSPLLETMDEFEAADYVGDYIKKFIVRNWDDVAETFIYNWMTMWTPRDVSPSDKFREEAKKQGFTQPSSNFMLDVDKVKEALGDDYLRYLYIADFDWCNLHEGERAW